MSLCPSCQQTAERRKIKEDLANIIAEFRNVMEENRELYGKVSRNLTDYYTSIYHTDKYWETVEHDKIKILCTDFLKGFKDFVMGLGKLQEEIGVLAPKIG